MGIPLFDRRSPREWAKASQPIVFEQEIAEFERLAKSLKDNVQGPDAQDSAETSEEKRIAGKIKLFPSAFGDDVVGLQGQACVTVRLICQRCLRPMNWLLQTDLDLIVAAEGRAPTSATQDVWEIEGERFSPAEILDEALVMALPFVARHDDDSCSAKASPDAIAETDTTRPFADLRARMETKT